MLMSIIITYSRRLILKQNYNYRNYFKLNLNLYAVFVQKYVKMNKKSLPSIKHMKLG